MGFAPRRPIQTRRMNRCRSRRWSTSWKWSRRQLKLEMCLWHSLPLVHSVCFACLATQSSTTGMLERCCFVIGSCGNPHDHEIEQLRKSVHLKRLASVVQMLSPLLKCLSVRGDSRANDRLSRWPYLQEGIQLSVPY